MEGTKTDEVLKNYAAELCSRSEGGLETYVSFYDEFCHAYIENIKKYAYVVMTYTDVSSYDFFYRASQKISRFVFNIITHSAQDNEKSYMPKVFQYIRDYNGRKKVIAKSYPPVFPKGCTRNTNNFKSYDRKLYNSISRSKQRVHELACCNDWEYFVTFTLDPKRYDRYNLEVYIKAFAKWLSNYSLRKTKGQKIHYILIPELDQRGAWHIHGLMNGVPLDHLSLFEKGKHPQYLIRRKYMNWKAYEKKFGFCSFGKIRDKKKVAGYITKYIKKSARTQERRLHSKLYYCTQGLRRSTEICRGYNMLFVDTYDFENEYVGIKWLDDT